MRARVVGFGGLEETVASWREILVEVRKRNPAALLLIDELHGKPLTARQWQALVDAMRGQGLEQTRIAHVKPAGRNSIEFCELFARDIGIDARVFEDEQTAVLWFERTDALPGSGQRDYGPLTISRDRDIDLPGVLRVRINGRSGDPASVLRVCQEIFNNIRDAGVLHLFGGAGHARGNIVGVRIGCGGDATSRVGPQGLRIALVQTRSNPQVYDERASLLGIERGFSVAVFANEASALLWLRYGEG